MNGFTKLTPVVISLRPSLLVAPTSVLDAAQMFATTLEKLRVVAVQQIFMVDQAMSII